MIELNGTTLKLTNLGRYNVDQISEGYFYNLDKIYLSMVLNARGSWKIQAFYPNGDYSNEFSFYVN